MAINLDMDKHGSRFTAFVELAAAIPARSISACNLSADVV